MIAAEQTTGYGQCQCGGSLGKKTSERTGAQTVEEQNEPIVAVVLFEDVLSGMQMTHAAQANHRLQKLRRHARSDPRHQGRERNSVGVFPARRPSELKLT